MGRGQGVRLGNVAAGAFRFNRSEIDWWFAARASLGVAIALIAGLHFGTRLDALAAGIGAVALGPTSLRGVYRTRAATMLATAVGMSLGAYIAALAGSSTTAIVLVTAAGAYLYGIISSLGDAASAVGLNSMIAIVILGNISTPRAQIGEVALFVLGGGVIQTMLVVLSWPLGRHVTERRALAKAYRTLAAYARTIRSAAATISPHASLLAVRTALADPQPLGHADELLAMQTLADECERIRETLSLIAATDAKNVEGLPEATADLLDAIADALEAGGTPVDAGLWKRANERLPDDPVWQRLYGQLRAAWRSASIPAALHAGRTPIADPALVPHVVGWWRVLGENVSFSSPFGRHAIRLAIVLALAILLFRLTHLERGYWMALTALLVLRPDFTTTFARGVARIAGTVLGVILAWGVGHVIPHTAQADAAAGIVFAAFGFLVFSVNWALYSVTITVFVLFMLAMAGTPESSALVARIVATLLGGALALAAYRAWPSQEAPLTRAALANLLDLLRDYARMLLGVYAGDEPVRPEWFEAQQRVSWTLRTEIEASIERMLGESDMRGELTRDQALAIFASTRRLGLANLALTSEVLAEVPPPVPAVRPFAQALDRAMQAVVEALRSGTKARDLPDLRTAYTAFAHSLKTSDDRSTRLLLAQCDLYVDSVNTIAEAL
jgi:uncharacterized membrane protein YccC